MTNLIVNYLPQNTTDNELFNLFITCGPIERCRVMKDYKTGYSYGFGFVNYTRPEDAEKAIHQLNGRYIFNKRIKVSYARPSGDNIKATNLYVTNLPKDYTEDNLRALFSPYGTIVKQNILFDKTTRSPRGVAFVRYSRKDEAQTAILNLNGRIPAGGKYPLTVRVAEEHGKQKGAYYAYLKKVQGGRPENLRGGRAGWIRGNYVGIIGRGTSTYNTNLVTYTTRPNNGFGPIRQDRNQQHFNPLVFGKSNNNGYGYF